MGFALVGRTWQRQRKRLMIYSSGPLARNTTPASLLRIGSLKRAVSFGQDEGSAWPTLPSLTLGKVEGTERVKIRYKTDANFLESVKASSSKEENSSRAFGPTIADFYSQVPVAEKQPGAVVNVSSQASQAALGDHTVYCATKGALDMVTKWVGKVKNWEVQLSKSSG